MPPQERNHQTTNQQYHRRNLKFGRRLESPSVLRSEESSQHYRMSMETQVIVTVVVFAPLCSSKVLDTLLARELSGVL